MIWKSSCRTPRQPQPGSETKIHQIIPRCRPVRANGYANFYQDWRTLLSKMITRYALSVKSNAMELQDKINRDINNGSGEPRPGV